MKRWMMTAVPAAVLAATVPGGGAAAAECKAVKLPDGSSEQYCKDAAGKWVPATSLARAMLPAKAEAQYDGTYVLTVSKPQRRKSKITLGDLIGGAMAQGDRYEGAITMKLTINGASVTGQVSGTGGISTLRVSGLVQNGRCRLIDDRNMFVYEGACNAEGFSGTVNSTSNSRTVQKAEFTTTMSSLTDVVAREAQQQQAGAELAAKRAQLKAQCDAGKITACVEMDQLR